MDLNFELKKQTDAEKSFFAIFLKYNILFICLLDMRHKGRPENIQG